MNEQAQTTPTAEAADPIAPLKSLAERDRKKAMGALNELFRGGKPPDPALDGDYKGEVVAMDIAPVLTQSVDLVTGFWMPWKGKYFVPAENRGGNLFSEDSRTALRLVYPFYRGFEDYETETFRGFGFETSVEKGMEDKDLDVFRIDYDNPESPALSIRRIVDELMQVADGVYLGKIHVKQWWGAWNMVGYFALRRPS